MLVFINSQSQNIPDGVDTVGKLLDHLRISRQGTGVGVNNRLIQARDWDNTAIHEEDRIMIISATYGG